MTSSETSSIRADAASSSAAGAYPSLAADFFAERAPALLANSAAAAAIEGRCRFEIRGQEAVQSWTVDCISDPPRVIAGADGPSDCCIAMTAAELAAIIDDPRSGQVLAWQGSLGLSGDQDVLRGVSDVLFPAGDGQDGRYAGYFASLNRLVPDARLTFLNHGFDDEDGDDFTWLDEALWQWRYSVKLVRRALAGAPVAGARVLDVGCGRGGPAAYIAACLAPREVIGLDACPEAVQLCARVHGRPGLRFVHGSAHELPFADASFDLVLNLESSHCYPDRRAFLREVERVLRPGATFCYADVVQPQELATIRQLIDDVPDFRVQRSDDITRGVALAIDRNRDGLARLLRDVTDPKLRNNVLVEQLIHSINVQIHEKYASGALQYHVWCIRKGKP